MVNYTGGKTNCKYYEACGNRENCSKCKGYLLATDSARMARARILAQNKLKEVSK
jgi:hypothetical protein